jgi:hypothetical protein
MRDKDNSQDALKLDNHLEQGNKGCGQSPLMPDTNDKDLLAQAWDAIKDDPWNNVDNMAETLALKYGELKSHALLDRFYERLKLNVLKTNGFEFFSESALSFIYQEIKKELGA